MRYAWGSHWGSFGEALGWLWGGPLHPSIWLVTSSVVALRWLAAPPEKIAVRTSPPPVKTILTPVETIFCPVAAVILANPADATPVGAPPTPVETLPTLAPPRRQESKPRRLLSPPEIPPT